MIEKAKKKLQAEMGSNKTNKYIQVVGDFLLQRIGKNEDDAEKIVTEGKTIAGSLNAMKEEARKNQMNGCGVLTDQEGFDVVLTYFGEVKAEKPKEEKPKAETKAKPKTTPKKTKKEEPEYDAELEALLG